MILTVPKVVPILLILILGSVLLNPAAEAQEEPGWHYGSRGWEWSNSDSGSYIWLGLRFQSRYSNRVDDPLISDQLRQQGEKGFNLNRARYKIGAGLGKHFTFYHEYDLRNGQLLDLRATWKPVGWFHLRAGQWKGEYNRERIDSSGKQQFVDRSISNYWFTIDRQNGVMASGRLAPGTRADTSWWLGVFNGNGLNTGGDGGRPMVAGRFQWNYTRTLLPFSQGSLKSYDPPRGSITAGFMTNDSSYTAFSSGGGGQLPGYGEGVDNQYRLQQFMLEYAWQHRGWSVQSELHIKDVTDRINSGTRRTSGGYIQAGWFPATRFKAWPAQLELAARFALVHPDVEVASSDNEEFSMGANWFFNGHRNKLTADIAILDITDMSGNAEDVRFRLQWDISL